MTFRMIALATTAVLAFGANAHAAEIKVLSTNALKSVLLDLGPKFEKSSGDKLAITWGTAAELTPQIAKGAAVDVAVITDAGVEGLIKQGKLASATPLARSGIAVAIKKGAAKPKLGSADDLKALLLSAKSIAYVATGASGI